MDDAVHVTGSSAMALQSSVGWHVEYSGSTYIAGNRTELNQDPAAAKGKREQLNMGPTRGRLVRAHGETV